MPHSASIQKCQCRHISCPIHILHIEWLSRHLKYFRRTSKTSMERDFENVFLSTLRLSASDGQQAQQTGNLQPQKWEMSPLACTQGSYKARHCKCSKCLSQTWHRFSHTKPPKIGITNMYFSELCHQVPMSACRLPRCKYFRLANSMLKTQFQCDFYPNLGRYGLYKGFLKYRQKMSFDSRLEENHAHCP